MGDAGSLGLTAEATSLRRLPDVPHSRRGGHGLGLTAEATSLRLFVGGLLGDALDSRLGLTAEATSLRLSRPSPRCAQPQGASA